MPCPHSYCTIVQKWLWNFWHVGKTCPQQPPRNVIPSVAPIYKAPVSGCVTIAVYCKVNVFVVVFEECEMWPTNQLLKESLDVFSCNCTFEKPLWLFPLLPWNQSILFPITITLTEYFTTWWALPFSYIMSLYHVLNTGNTVTFSKATQRYRPNHTTPTPHCSHTQECELLHQHFIRRLNKEKESHKVRPLCLHRLVESLSEMFAGNHFLEHETTQFNKYIWWGQVSLCVSEMLKGENIVLFSCTCLLYDWPSLKYIVRSVDFF